ncbi:MAG TPA: UDP-N-acetylglucosamine 2-epimerase (non-hydrolyzing) [Bryobacteraceae bacterium]|jgi:UDP-N-acetylglucosamine 2-epimerase (non-hydrolysing)|nr:UDP-N-acetylglucosamine 2-epimerase (non-hydrolyzing) [Bryobacteraceae bacterium]
MTSPRDESRTGINSSSTRLHRILVVFGTRPEAIKLCPLVKLLRQSHSSEIETIVCVTGQHREMLDQVLAAFDVQPDYDLALMRPEQSLTGLSSQLLGALESVLGEVKPSITVVQGDTTTTFCAALASFYARVPVAHVEAGLRTGDPAEPFPEEMNRVLTTRLAALHFAATEAAACNLTAEGVAKDSIYVTGNPGIDAVLQIKEALGQGRLSGLELPEENGRKTIVVTAHRRESFGPDLREICNAIGVLAEREDLRIVWPVHPNPNVRSVVDATLRGRCNVLLLEPLDYVPFVDLMRRAYLLITDSGGIQEEGPSLGKPVLVLRNKTERPEAVHAGTATLTGTNRDSIVREALRLIEDQGAYEAMARVHNPYGDGRASERIAGHLRAYLIEQISRKGNKARR